MSYFVLFDDAINNSARLYMDYKYSQYIRPAELKELDSHLRDGWGKGLYPAFFIDYEFGFKFQDLPEKPDAYLVLHWFADKTEIQNVDTWLKQNYQAKQPAGISQTDNDNSRADYIDSINQIQRAICDGETYQINYTTRLHLHAYGEPIKLYHRLRQNVPYGVLAKLPALAGAQDQQNQSDQAKSNQPNSNQPNWTLSFSPELFLNIDANGLLSTKPMKGTAPILHDGQDEQRAQDLRLDPKNRAENIMIVDLLRNDLGKIAQIGSVKVSEPLNVSRFGNVWQMTTTVHAKPLPDVGMSGILAATFPCGSITGAPKRKSMQIIDSVESSRRGIYTGSIGWLDKCESGLGFYGNLNVVIRTLELKPVPNADDLYQGVYGVGSGIVADSIGGDEFEECQWKASFLNNLQPEFSIFETMAVQSKKCTLLPLHLARLQKSAKALNIQFNHQNTIARLGDYLSELPDDNYYRVKMILDSNGELNFVSAPYTPISGLQSVIIAEQRLNNHDYLRRFKTSHRNVYDHGWQHAAKLNAFDSLFFNHDNYLLEGGRSTVFVQIDGQWHTPTLDLDILNGVMRQQIIQNSQHYLGTDHIHESLISYDMLCQAKEIRLCNALHGLFRAELVL